MTVQFTRVCYTFKYDAFTGNRYAVFKGFHIVLMKNMTTGKRYHRLDRDQSHAIICRCHNITNAFYSLLSSAIEYDY